MGLVQTSEWSNTSGKDTRLFLGRNGRRCNFLVAQDTQGICLGEQVDSLLDLQRRSRARKLRWPRRWCPQSIDTIDAAKASGFEVFDWSGYNGETYSGNRRTFSVDNSTVIFAQLFDRQKVARKIRNIIHSGHFERAIDSIKWDVSTEWISKEWPLPTRTLRELGFGIGWPRERMSLVI